MVIFSLGFCLSLLRFCVGFVLSVTTGGQANLRMSLAKFMPKRNLVMALEVQQDIWNCSPTEGVSESGYTICEGQLTAIASRCIFS